MKNNQTLFCNGALVHDVSDAALRSEVAICCWQMGCGLGSQAIFYNRWGAVASASLWGAKQGCPISTVISAEAPTHTRGPRRRLHLMVNLQPGYQTLRGSSTSRW